jgi:metal-dependent amidase/aminoacylase/carboxypeptidase family protein
MSEFLKCDATGCDHIEDVAEIVAEMIGKQCPKCGANLLTSEDFEFYSTVMKPGMAAMTALGLSRPASSDDPEHLKMRVHGHNRELHIKMPPTPSQTERNEG